MKNATLISLLLFLIVFGNRVEGSHVMGGDISWKAMNEDTFQVKVTLYRDCNGLNMETPNFKTHCMANNTQLNAPKTLLNKSKEDVTPLCPKMCSACKSNCNRSNTFKFGIQKIQATYLVDLSKINCCKIRFSYQNCCRNQQISTGPARQEFYLKGWFNRCKAPKHQSPKFKNNPLGILCTGQPFVFNQGVTSPSNKSGDNNYQPDSLSLNLTKPLQRPGNPVNFNQPYQYDLPFKFEGFPRKNVSFPAGFHVNDKTGNIKFTPTKAQTSVMAFEANGYKNGSQVSHVRRDMQFSVINCPKNQAPSIAGINCKNNHTLKGCEGDTLKFSTCVEDKNVGDSIHLTLKKNNVPGQLTYQAKPLSKTRKKLNFKWVTPKNETRENFQFYLVAKDDHCPVNGRAMKAFNLKLKDQPNAAIKKESISCNLYRFKALPKGFNANNLKFNWQMNNQTRSNFQQFYQRLEFSGSLPLRLRLESNHCKNVLKDTLKAPNSLKVDIGSDTTLCYNSSISLGGMAQNARGEVKYIWQDGITGNKERQFTKLKQDTLIHLTVKDTQCAFTDTVRIDIKAKPNVQLGDSEYFCPGDTLDLNLKTVDQPSPSVNTPKVLVSSKSKIKKYDWRHLPDQKKLGSKPTLKIQEEGKYALRVENNFGCYGSDTLSVKKLPEISIESNPKTICEKDSGVLKAKLASSKPKHWETSHQWKNKINGKSFTGTSIAINPEDTINYILKSSWNPKIGHHDQCQVTKNFTKRLKKKPVILFDSLPKVCANAKPFNLEPFAEPKGGRWTTKNSKGVNNNKLQPKNLKPGNHAITYHFIDSQTHCKTQKTTTLFIQKPPKIDAGPDTSLCPGQKTLRIKGHPSLPKGAWKGPGITQKGNDWYFDATANAVDSGKNQLIYKIEPTPLNSCSNRDTLNINVVKRKSLKIPRKVNICPNDSLLSQISKLPANGFWKIPQPDLKVRKGKIVKKENGLTGKFKAYFKPKAGCDFTDSTLLQLREKPQITFVQPNKKELCSTKEPFKLKAQPAHGKWKGNAILNQNTFYPGKAGAGSHKLSYLYEDPQSGCKAKKTLSIKIQKSPDVKIWSNQKTFCENHNQFPFNVKYKNSDSVEISSYPESSNQNKRFEISSYNQKGLKGYYFPSEKEKQKGVFKVVAKTKNQGVCPSKMDSLSITINRLPNLDFNTAMNSKEGCPPKKFWLQTDLKNLEDVDIKDYNWTIGKKNFQSPRPVLKLRKPRKYDAKLIATTFKGCSDTVFKPDYLKVLNKPIADFAPSKRKVSQAEKVKLKNLSNTKDKGYDFKWSLTNEKGESIITNEKSPQVQFKDTGFYDVSLKVINQNGCKDTMTKTNLIQVFPQPVVYIPNAFSPNGDGENDQYRIKAKYIKAFHFKIFNRWGETVYQSNSLQDHGWDGKFKSNKAPVGNYFYKLKVKGLNNNYFKYSGSLNLIR